MKFREVKCPSGATLKVMAAPFAEAKALYKAVLVEAKGIDIGTKLELPQLLKNVLVAGFASDHVEACLWACLARSTYNTGSGDLKIDASTFEPHENREDYVKVCIEVAEENIRPFMKSLYSVWLQTLATIEIAQESRREKTKEANSSPT